MSRTRRRRSRRQRPSEPRQVTIEALSHEGRGIAHVNGKTLFVSGALVGEQVLAQVYNSNRNYDQAHTLEVIEASPQRISPRCEFFEVCGGCSLQHLSDDDQLALKQQMLLDMLEHAGVEFDELMPILRGPAWGYRNKARLGVKNVPRKGRVLVGFRERQTPFIADMTSCEVLLPAVGHRLEAISAMLGELDARAKIPQIEVAADDSRVQLVFWHLEPLSQADQERLLDFGKKHEFMIQLQPGGPDSVHNLYPQEQSLVLVLAVDVDVRRLLQYRNRQ